MSYQKDSKEELSKYFPRVLTKIIGEYSIEDFVEEISNKFFRELLSPKILEKIHLEPIIQEAVPNFDTIILKIQKFYLEYPETKPPHEIFEEMSTKIKLPDGFLGVENLAEIIDSIWYSVGNIPFYSLYPFFDDISFVFLGRLAENFSLAKQGDYLDYKCFAYLIEYALTGKVVKSSQIRM